MIFKNIATIFFIVLITFLQISFFKNLPFFGGIDFILSLLIFTVLIDQNKYTIYLIFVGGFILDLYSALPFGFYTISFLLLFLMMRLLQYRVFSDYSIISTFFMVIFATFLLDLLIFSFSQLASLFFTYKITFVYGDGYFTQTFWQGVLNFIFVSLLYKIALKINKNLNRSFISANNRIR